MTKLKDLKGEKFEGLGATLADALSDAQKKAYVFVQANPDKTYLNDNVVSTREAQYIVYLTLVYSD